MSGLECTRKGRPPQGGFSVNNIPKRKIKLPQIDQEELKYEYSITKIELNSWKSSHN